MASLAAGEDGNDPLPMVLSVSSGDSGGGIFRGDTNELVSVVCCTSGMARKVSMWGCSAEVARRTRPKPADDADEAWVPVPIPICGRPEAGDRRLEPNPKFDDDWKPVPIPLRAWPSLSLLQPSASRLQPSR